MKRNAQDQVQEGKQHEEKMQCFQFLDYMLLH